MFRMSDGATQLQVTPSSGAGDGAALPVDARVTRPNSHVGHDVRYRFHVA